MPIANRDDFDVQGLTGFMPYEGLAYLQTNQRLAQRGGPTDATGVYVGFIFADDAIARARAARLFDIYQGTEMYFVLRLSCGIDQNGALDASLEVAQIAFDFEETCPGHRIVLRGELITLRQKLVRTGLKLFQTSRRNVVRVRTLRPFGHFVRRQVVVHFLDEGAAHENHQ